MTISEKVAYIQGLFDGMGLDKAGSGESKILSEVLDVLKEVGAQLEQVETTLDEFGEEIDAVSDDLSDVEGVLFGEEDAACLDKADEDFLETACPNCGEVLVVDDAVLKAGTIACPACGERFALSIDEDVEGGGSCGNCCCGSGDE